MAGKITRFIIACIFIFSATIGLSLAIQVCLPTDRAYAAISVGGNTIEGYQPSDIVQTDISADNANPSAATQKLESTVIALIKVVIPVLAVACVVKIVWTAIRNMFRKKEKQEPLGGVIKNIFVGFFYIFFAWIIVEGIIFVLTGGETLLSNILV